MVSDSDKPAQPTRVLVVLLAMASAVLLALTIISLLTLVDSTSSQERFGGGSIYYIFTLWVILVLLVGIALYPRAYRELDRDSRSPGTRGQIESILGMWVIALWISFATLYGVIVTALKRYLFMVGAGNGSLEGILAFGLVAVFVALPYRVGWVYGSKKGQPEAARETNNANPETTTPS